MGFSRISRSLVDISRILRCRVDMSRNFRLVDPSRFLRF